MTGILVDSNIILDIFLDDPKWANWSESTLERYSQSTTLYINPVVYTEISISFERIEDLEFAILQGGFKMLQFSKEVLFLAGKAFLKYKKNKGKKVSTLPDFYIGAQAAILDFELITRDVARYRTYFPTVRLINP
ncbi:MAG: type II toxin-antitoxin system VapC family toxin [Spirochaetota bacterium]|nr:type II toxin-antitoxin system VapC family toxin [Spirochaetota bacterium]